MLYTDEQLAVSDYRGDRLLVSSLAGTGKTQTVSKRIERLLKEDKSILCLCFTNAAVDQLNNRLITRDLKNNKVTVSTIDSFIGRMLEPFNVNISDCLTVASETFKQQGLNVSLTDIKSFQKLAAFNLFQNGETEVSIPGVTPAMMIELFKAFDEKKKLAKRLDFADATILATRFIEAHPERFNYDEVIIDEAQDLNPIQLRFVEVLSKNSTLTFVGDKNQSIFGFAGVNADLFSAFCEGWDELRLTKSFRSPDNIVKAINGSLKNLTSDVLTTDVEGGLVLKGDDEQAIEWINEKIAQGIRPAILGATRFDLSSIAKKFESAGLNVYRSWLNAKSEERYSDIVFTSIHKVKGLEYDNVLVKNLPKYGYSGCDGKRLTYVALSRAKKELFVNNCNGGDYPDYIEGVNND